MQKQELEDCYPEIYRIVYPMVQKVCSQNTMPITRQLINNMVVGVSSGFTKSLTVKGVGYKLNKQGNKLVMNLGLSHPVEVLEADGVTLECPDNNTILVKGANKERVGAMAAKIRALRPMEPYHGYGIHYTSEPVILKAGKSGGKKK